MFGCWISSLSPTLDFPNYLLGSSPLQHVGQGVGATVRALRGGEDPQTGPGGEGHGSGEGGGTIYIYIYIASN